MESILLPLQKEKQQQKIWKIRKKIDYEQSVKEDQSVKLVFQVKDCAELVACSQEQRDKLVAVQSSSEPDSRKWADAGSGRLDN